MASKFALETSLRIGWIGTGVMGSQMCRHLARKSACSQLSISSRTAEKAERTMRESLAARKDVPTTEAHIPSLTAQLCVSPREVAENSDVVFTMVGLPSDVRHVVLDPEDGVLAGWTRRERKLSAAEAKFPHRVLVDMTTSSPDLAKEIARVCSSHSGPLGLHCLDAPVSGGDVGAQEARLSIMCGDEPFVFDAVQPLLACMGTSVKLLGEAGSGQNTKMVNQLLIASAMVGVCEGLLYAHKAGLPLRDVIEAVRGGAAGNKSLDLYFDRMLRRDWSPGFFVEHFVKDLEIALGECQRMHLTLPGLSLAKQLYNKLVELRGNGRDGTQALLLVLESMNDIEVPPQ